MKMLLDFFETEVKSKFSFLEKDYNCDLISVERNSSFVELQYETNLIVVRFLFGSPKHEITFLFGRKGIDDIRSGKMFTISDLIHASEKKRVITGEFLSFNNESINQWLNYISEKLVSCGHPYLTGDKKAYSHLSKVRSNNISKWHLDIKMKQAREDLSVAWQNHDYANVIKTLKPLSKYLNPIEKKKLKYAQKMHADKQ